MAAGNVTMQALILAQQHVYGFEGRTQETIFVVGFSGLLILGVLLLKISFRQLVFAGMLMACLSRRRFVTAA